MYSGAGLRGTTRTTRGGGGSPMRIPKETCALAAEPAASKIAANNAVLTKVFTIHPSHNPD
jgi:hypothetical protein